MHRNTLVAIALGAVSFAGCGGHSEPTSPKKVLLISIDALRADHLGSWGYDRDTSPFLDQLVSEGTRYPLAFVNTHGTPPSHTTMLTSLYQESHRVGMHDDPERPPDVRLPDAAETVQRVLHRHGWATVAVTGGGYMGREFGFSGGFDVFFDRIRSVEQGAETLVEAIRQVLGEERPVFVLFHTYQVHSPYTAPDIYDGLFGPDRCSIEPVAETLVPLQATASEHLSADDFDCLASLYDRGIRHTDDVLRGAFEDLRAIGFLDNTLVIITADHGEEFGDHGGLLHRGSLFDELLHVPLIVWGTGVPSGATDPALVSTIDISPTILAWAEIEIPAQIEGRNLFELPEGDQPQRVFSQYGSQIYSLRTPQWKLIVGGNWVNPMLFDLGRDSREKRNVARDYPVVVDSLIDELTVWRETRPRPNLSTRPPMDIGEETKQQLEALGYLN